MPRPMPTRGDVARDLWRLLEPIHAVVYFAPEPLEEFRAAGYRGFWMGYFAGRAAPLGRVGADVVHALFYNFAYERVSRAVSAAALLRRPRPWKPVYEDQCVRSAGHSAPQPTAQIRHGRQSLPRVPLNRRRSKAELCSPPIALCRCLRSLLPNCGMPRRFFVSTAATVMSRLWLPPASPAARRTSSTRPRVGSLAMSTRRHATSTRRSGRRDATP